MKGAPIKPGTVCMVINDSVKSNNGAFVTAMRRTPDQDPYYVGGNAWLVDNPSRQLHGRNGLPLIPGRIVAPAICLLPITDPDADVSDDERIKFDFHFDLPSKV